MQVAILTERYDQLVRDRNSDKEDIETVKKELEEIHNMANRWKGGFAVVVFFGAVIGWILSNLDAALKIFGRG